MLFSNKMCILYPPTITVSQTYSLHSSSSGCKAKIWRWKFILIFHTCPKIAASTPQGQQASVLLWKFWSTFHKSSGSFPLLLLPATEYLPSPPVLWELKSVETQDNSSRLGKAHPRSGMLRQGPCTDAGHLPGGHLGRYGWPSSVLQAASWTGDLVVFTSLCEAQAPRPEASDCFSPEVGLPCLGREQKAKGVVLPDRSW